MTKPEVWTLTTGTLTIKVVRADEVVESYKRWRRMLWMWVGMCIGCLAVLGFQLWELLH